MLKTIKKHVSQFFRNIGVKFLRIEEMEEFYNYLHSPWRIMWTNFLAGTMRGLGFLLGAAIVITVIGFAVKAVLSNIPIVGDFFTAVNEWIQSTINNKGS